MPSVLARGDPRAVCRAARTDRRGQEEEARARETTLYKLVKLVARNLGDGDSASGDQSTHDIDLSVLTSADVIVAVVTIYNAADGSTNTMCTQFESPLLKTVGGTGTRYLSKTSTLPATCPVCGNGIAEPGEECVTP